MGLGASWNPRAADLLCDLGLAIEELRPRDVTGSQAEDTGDMSHSITMYQLYRATCRTTCSATYHLMSYRLCVVLCRGVSYHVRVLCHTALRLFMAIAGFGLLKVNLYDPLS